jgi:uncharacterized protein YdhG (YjbR/CyaY superfamily)
MKNSDAPVAKNINEYLAQFPENVQIALEELRHTIKEIVPQAEEVISYQIPAFKYHGMLVYFAAYKNHCSFFVGNGSLVGKMQDELNAYQTTKSAIHFTVEKPLPKALIEKIVRLRMAENDAIQAAKANKKAKK